MAVILSYVLSTPQFLPLEVFPEQFLLQHCGGRVQGSHKTKKHWGSQGLEACVCTQAETHTTLSLRKTSNLQKGNLSQNVLSSGLPTFPFLPFFPFFYYAIIKNVVGKIL